MRRTRSATRDLWPGRSSTSTLAARKSGLLRSQLADPDVPEADRVRMVLQPERQLVRVRRVRRPRLVRGGPAQLAVVLDEHAVEKDGHARRRENLARGVEARGAEHDILGLPLAGRTRGVHEG